MGGSRKTLPGKTNTPPSSSDTRSGRKGPAKGNLRNLAVKRKNSAKKLGVGEPPKKKYKKKEGEQNKKVQNLGKDGWGVGGGGPLQQKPSPGGEYPRRLGGYGKGRSRRISSRRPVAL